MRSLLIWLIPRLAWAYIHFVAFTSRVSWKNQESEDHVKEQYSALIYAFWHGRQVFLTWTHRHTALSVLVSQSKDGEYIARIIQLFGMQTIRGSTSRGGMKSVIQLKDTLMSGRSVAITPDGPRGPQRTVTAGTLFLAQRTNRPILPVTYSAKKKLIFKGWDEYWVPLPFNEILITYGNPIIVNPNDNLEEKAFELRNELNRITDYTDQLVS